MLKDNGSPGFSLLEKGILNMERKKTRMNLVTLKWN